MTSFSNFIAPFDVQTFLADYYGKRPVHIRRETHALPDILNWARFNAALAVTPYWTEDSLKLFFKNRAALRDNYCDPAEARGRAANVNPHKVKALIAVGASVVANHIHRICPEVNTFVHAIEQQFRSRVFANVYCSFTGVQAFQTHYDLHDVFAFQAEGEKLWRVYEARADSPVSPVPPGDEAEKWLIQSRGRLLFETTMKRGDVLYLPRGQYHDAIADSQPSLHVTFGISSLTGLSVFKLLEAVAIRESPFRAYLPDGRDPAELQAHLAHLGQRVAEIMKSPMFTAEILNHQSAALSAIVDFDLPRQERPIWYSLARDVRLQRRDRGVTLSWQGGELELGADYAAVEWIVNQRQFSVQELSARFGAGGQVQPLVDRLLEVGILTQTEMQ